MNVFDEMFKENLVKIETIVLTILNVRGMR